MQLTVRRAADRLQCEHGRTRPTRAPVTDVAFGPRFILKRHDRHRQAAAPGRLPTVLFCHWHGGEYKLGKKHGKGAYSWPDGSYYIGEWSENCIQGQGEYIWGDGRRYKGEWKNNKMHGFGVHTW